MSAEDAVAPPDDAAPDAVGPPDDVVRPDSENESSEAAREPDDLELMDGHADPRFGPLRLFYILGEDIFTTARPHSA